MCRSVSGTGFHALRHFYAPLLIRHGESVKVVQSRLGYASAAETLDTYSHLSRATRTGDGCLMLGRPDLSTFVVDAIYKDTDTDEPVQFLGVAAMPELDREDVGVFRFLDRGECLIATQRSFDQGETFQPLR